MARYFILCVIFFPCLPVTGQYYLNHINVIDVEKGSIIKDQPVYIEGNSIKSISSQPIANSAVLVYDCSDKYIMPGLWDMHIHDAGDDSSNRFEYVPLFLANGVTGIRDMWGSEEMLTLKKDIAEGRLTGPRMIIGSPIIDGEKPFFTNSLAASTETLGPSLCG